MPELNFNRKLPERVPLELMVYSTENILHVMEAGEVKLISI
jgi:hypothetical protein